ncbi:hypothetical protein BX600DRAFT_86941 [Xylariales sp. PMI_506]|nr:hypothetical protein BX600DRAFT_86941 [Xylariales sp. PMI_506]
MAAPVKTLVLPSNPHKGGFLGLPKEIRDLIYVFTLSESSIITKRHSATCSHKPTNRHEPETPAFITTGTTGYYNHSRKQNELQSTCACAKRRGLDLLQTNRKVHTEAASVFWSNNIFTFRSAADFASCVGNNLRPGYRNLLQYISIICIYMGQYHVHRYHPVKKKSTQALEILISCKSLRELEIPSELFETNFGRFCTLRNSAAGLQSVKLAGIQIYEYTLGNRRQINRRYYQNEVEVYIFASFNFLLGNLEPSFNVMEFVRYYQYNFLVHLKYAITKDLLKSDGSYYSPLLIKGLCNASTQPKLLLRDGTIAQPLILGLPPSKATHKQHVRMRRQENTFWHDRKERETQHTIAQARKVKAEKVNDERYEKISVRASEKLAECELWTNEQLKKERQNRVARSQDRDCSIREIAETRKIERRRPRTIQGTN